MIHAIPNAYAAAHTACILLAAAIEAADTRAASASRHRAPVLEALSEAERLAAQIRRRLTEAMATGSEPGTVIVYPSGLPAGEGLTVPRRAVALAPLDSLHVCIVEPEDPDAPHSEAILCEVLHRLNGAQAEAAARTLKAGSVVTPSGTVEPVRVSERGPTDANRLVLVEDDLSELGARITVARAAAGGSAPVLSSDEASGIGYTLGDLSPIAERIGKHLSALTTPACGAVWVRDGECGGMPVEVPAEAVRTFEPSHLHILHIEGAGIGGEVLVLGELWRGAYENEGAACVSSGEAASVATDAGAAGGEAPLAEMPTPEEAAIDPSDEATTDPGNVSTETAAPAHLWLVETLQSFRCRVELCESAARLEAEEAESSSLVQMLSEIGTELRDLEGDVSSERSE